MLRRAAGRRLGCLSRRHDRRLCAACGGAVRGGRRPAAGVRRGAYACAWGRHRPVCALAHRPGARVPGHAVRCAVARAMRSNRGRRRFDLLGGRGAGPLIEPASARRTPSAALPPLRRLRDIPALQADTSRPATGTAADSPEPRGPALFTAPTRSAAGSTPPTARSSGPAGPPGPARSTVSLSTHVEEEPPRLVEASVPKCAAARPVHESPGQAERPCAEGPRLPGARPATLGEHEEVASLRQMPAQPLDPSHEPLVQFAAAGRQVAGRRESPAEDRHAEEDGFDERRLPRKEGDQQEGVEVRAMVADDDRAADVANRRGDPPAQAGRHGERRGEEAAEVPVVQPLDGGARPARDQRHEVRGEKEDGDPDEIDPDGEGDPDVDQEAHGARRGHPPTRRSAGGRGRC